MTGPELERCDLFAVAPPGLEAVVERELQALGVRERRIVPGGVECVAPPRAILMLNRALRVAVRLLLRVGSFRAVHLSELSRRTRALPWERYVRAGDKVRVKATCHKSAIYHSGAARQRVQEAVAAALGAPLASVENADDAAVEVLVRLDNNACVISIDTSGEPLYRRGYKEDVAKAPLRENLAAGILALCGWQVDEPLVDPMCGSGTLALEAALWRAGILPGAARRFACMDWPLFARRPADAKPPARQAAPASPSIFAYDRNAGAIAATRANAARAGVSDFVAVAQQSLTSLRAPAACGLVVCNPPYGERLGDVKALRNLYAALGNVMRGVFAGWRLGLVTSNAKLAHATGLTFCETSPPLPHGGLKIRVYQWRPTVEG